MLTAFPHMGNNWPAFKWLVEAMGGTVYMTNPNNTRQIEKGIEHSPEWVCFPFKTTLSNFIEALDAGAEVLLMATDCGPCRFGFYYAVQERILRDLGYRFEMKHLPQDDLLTFEWVGFFRSFATGDRRPTLPRIFRTAMIFFQKGWLIQLAERLEGLTRCRETHNGDTTATLKRCIAMIDEASTTRQLRRLKYVIPREFKAVAIDPGRDVLKVGLTGEIQVTLDPFTNHDIKRKLGELGCEVHMNLSMYDWVLHKLHLNFHRKYLARLSKAHRRIGGLQMDIGGEALWVLGEYMEWTRLGFDGFVHIYPFTCMPEITAKSIITKWYGDRTFDLPPAFFGFDEQSGDAGMLTRLEAYVDLLRARRKGRKS